MRQNLWGITRRNMYFVFNRQSPYFVWFSGYVIFHMTSSQTSEAPLERYEVTVYITNLIYTKKRKKKNKSTLKLTTQTSNIHRAFWKQMFLCVVQILWSGVCFVGAPLRSALEARSLSLASQWARTRYDLNKPSEFRRSAGDGWSNRIPSHSDDLRRRATCVTYTDRSLPPFE